MENLKSYLNPQDCGCVFEEYFDPQGGPEDCVCPEWEFEGQTKLVGEEEEEEDCF